MSVSRNSLTSANVIAPSGKGVVVADPVALDVEVVVAEGEVVVVAVVEVVLDGFVDAIDVMPGSSGSLQPAAKVTQTVRSNGRQTDIAVLMMYEAVGYL